MKKPPQRYKALAITGLIIESIILSIHNPFFSIIEISTKAEAYIYMIHFPLTILCIASCLLLLYKKINGLYIARYTLSAIIFIEIIDLIFSISYRDIYDYISGIIVTLIYCLVLKYWMKKEHFEFLSS